MNVHSRCAYNSRRPVRFFLSAFQLWYGELDCNRVPPVMAKRRHPNCSRTVTLDKRIVFLEMSQNVPSPERGTTQATSKMHPTWSYVMWAPFICVNLCSKGRDCLSLWDAMRHLSTVPVVLMHSCPAFSIAASHRRHQLP